MAFYITEGVHLAQAALSAYGIVSSLIAITNLRRYEQQSEQAAKISDTAAHQLHKTRTTQASGMVGALASLGASLALAISGHKFSTTSRMLASPALLVLTLAVRTHMRNFWTDKSKVPMASGYNAAIMKTQELLAIFQYLEYSWVLASMSASIFGYQ